MGGEVIQAGENGAARCPRTENGSIEDDPCECPALTCVTAAEPSGEHLAQCVEALLSCRAFLWDVLMDGGWTGCARKRLKLLTALYGPEAVGEAFDG